MIPEKDYEEVYLSGTDSDESYKKYREQHAAVRDSMKNSMTVGIKRRTTLKAKTFAGMRP